MRVALVLYHFPVQSETFVIQHALALSRAGVDLKIIVQKETGDWEKFDPSIARELKERVFVLPKVRLSQWPSRFVANLFSRRGMEFLNLNRLAFQSGSRNVLKELPAWTEMPPLGRFDSILAHFGPIGVLALLLRKAGVIVGPIATVFHGYEMSRHTAIKRYRKGYVHLFRQAGILLPISKAWQQRLLEWGAPEQSIEVLHMGVDLPEKTPDFSRSLQRPLRILAVGRLAPKKGHTDTIKAIANCDAEVSLKIVGSGEQWENLHALARSIPGKDILFLGPRPHNEVLEELGKTDLFVLPSVTADDGEMEGIPVVLMEAMAHGAIVVSTWHSGIPELVAHGETGFLVDEHDPEAIAKLVDEIAEGKHDVTAMRKNAYKIVRDEFNNDSQNVKLLEILKKLPEITRLD